MGIAIDRAASRSVLRCEGEGRYSLRSHPQSQAVLGSTTRALWCGIQQKRRQDFLALLQSSITLGRESVRERVAFRVDVEYSRRDGGMTSAAVSLDGSNLVRSCENGADKLLEVPEAADHMDNHLAEVIVMLREWAQPLAEEDG